MPVCPGDAALEYLPHLSPSSGFCFIPVTSHPDYSISLHVRPLDFIVYLLFSMLMLEASFINVTIFLDHSPASKPTMASVHPILQLLGLTFRFVCCSPRCALCSSPSGTPSRLLPSFLNAPTHLFLPGT